MAASHPALAYYEGTREATFPLVLVVGREPNESQPTSPYAGPYRFDDSPACAFWNISYGLAADFADPPMKTAQLKRACSARKASLILYADALPITIKNEIGSKRAFRLNVPAAAIEDHVEAVFSHQDLIDRVRLVLLSGLSASEFSRSVSAYHRACEIRELPCEAVPFFYPTNAQRIRDALHPQSKATLRNIMAEFVPRFGSELKFETL